MTPSRPCRVLSAVILTIVTLCSVVSQTVCSGASSRSRTRQRDSSPALVDVIITPVLRQLHWLPVRQRVDFRLALLLYKALHDSTAAYLVDDCQLVSYSGRRRLRSAGIDTCCVPRIGDGALQPLDRSFGTVCRPGFASPTMTLENFLDS